MVLASAKVVLSIVATLAMPCVSKTVVEEIVVAATVRSGYINHRYGFAFAYPTSWSLIENKGVQSGGAVLSLKLLSPDENVPVRRDYSPGSASIEVFANPARLPLHEWLDDHGWPFEAAGRSETPTSVGGQPALEVATGKMFAPNRFTYVASGEWVLRLSALAPEAETVVQSIRFSKATDR